MILKVKKEKDAVKLLNSIITYSQECDLFVRGVDYEGTVKKLGLDLAGDFKKNKFRRKDKDSPTEILYERSASQKVTFSSINAISCLFRDKLILDYRNEAVYD